MRTLPSGEWKVNQTLHGQPFPRALINACPSPRTPEPEPRALLPAMVTGGGDTADAGFFDFHIREDHASGNGWLVSATNDDLTGGFHLTAYAECASLS